MVHRSLVAGQVALAMLLLAGTGAAVRTLVGLYSTPLNYSPQNVLIAVVDREIGRDADWAARASFYGRLQMEIANVPQVESVSIGMYTAPPPSSVGRQSGIEVNDAPLADDHAQVHTVGSNYFSTYRMRLTRGTGWSAFDDAHASAVAVINETMVRRFWENKDPIGQRFRAPDFVAVRNQFILPAPTDDGAFEVIGVVRDVPNTGLQESPEPAMYIPYTHMLADSGLLTIRTTQDPLTMQDTIRARVAAVDGRQPITRFLTADEYLEGQGWSKQRFVARLLLGFAGLALVLAAVGLFSVVSYTVALRTKEFGIRIALGAARARVLWLALRSALIAIAAGLVIGLVLSLSSGGILAARWSIRNVNDPLVLMAVSCGLIAVAAVATLIPGRRAVLIQPATALRTD